MDRQTQGNSIYCASIASRGNKRLLHNDCRQYRYKDVQITK